MPADLPDARETFITWAPEMPASRGGSLQVGSDKEVDRTGVPYRVAFADNGARSTTLQGVVGPFTRGLVA